MKRNKLSDLSAFANLKEITLHFSWGNIVDVGSFRYSDWLKVAEDVRNGCYDAMAEKVIGELPVMDSGVSFAMLGLLPRKPKRSGLWSGQMGLSRLFTDRKEKQVSVRLVYRCHGAAGWKRSATEEVEMA